MQNWNLDRFQIMGLDKGTHFSLSKREVTFVYVDG